MPTRAAIVLLLILNLGVAAWWLLHSGPAPVAPTRSPGVPRLQLLAEAAPDARQPATAPTPAPPVQAAATQVPAPAPASEPVKPPVREETPATQAPAGATACAGPDAGADGWRVYLPQLATAAEAEATASRIRDAGFSDYLVMRGDDDANAIALGRYSTRDAAQRRTASLRAAGFQARCARIAASTPA
jgi:cell division septation protein DedD